jgi:uncharacterized protein YyaL (SSP411 family)
MPDQHSNSSMNHLEHETSPYLLQHKNNPVDWYPWSDKTLQLAKEKNQLLIISIGYAACHWCHVMEHESFEDSKVAEVMNEYFISIKVDREERPDIDQIYMNAAMITTGHGGWPLNVIALPDGKPVFAGTYFPKQNWIKVLLYFADLYQHEPQTLIEQAERITEGLHQVDHLPLNDTERTLPPDLPDRFWSHWRSHIDFEWGGKRGAPKFMMPNNYTFLLRYLYHSKNAETAEAIKITLKRWAFGGLFDIVGGGFARYSVDAFWKVPHFEKMLCDNAQLLSVYAEAYRITKRPLYQSVVEKTFGWMEREMTDESGGLYSSLDADSEGIEGKFYCWTEEEFTSVIAGMNHGAELPDANLIQLAKELYGITTEGNFEHGMNVLFRTKDHEHFIEKYKISNEQFHWLAEHINQALFDRRAERIKPGTDDKLLTEWNALAIKGFADCFKAFGEQRYLDKAIRTAAFIMENCSKGNYRLDRNYKNGRSSINAFLGDYAFFIEALIALHEITLEEKYLRDALHFTEYVIAHFYNRENGMFFITSDIDAALITRSMDSSDNVIPAGNSQMAKNLLLLSRHFDKPEYEQMSLAMVNNVLDDVVKNPPYYSNWAIVIDMHLHLNKELVIAGNHAGKVLQQFYTHYLPDIVFTGATSPSELPLLKDRYIQDKTLIYLCENRHCELPSEDADSVLKSLVR